MMVIFTGVQQCMVYYVIALYILFNSWFEGIPTYPDAGRSWAIVDKFKVNSVYTAPTLIRTLMKFVLCYCFVYSLQLLV